MSSTTHSNTQLLENARFLHAYLECSDSIQNGIQAMLRIVFADDTSEDEKAMALHTIADCLYPNPHKGHLGMDLEESESEASQESPELFGIVAAMNAEEATFADRLRRIMDSRQITQSDLAARIGIGQPAISNMLNRQCRPQRRTIVKLASALDVQPQELWPSLDS